MGVLMRPMPASDSPAGALPAGEASARSVLVLGANGRLGRACVDAFHQAGWRVSAFRRASDKVTSTREIAAVHGDACQQTDVINAACGHDVIVNAVNTAYGRWASLTPLLTEAVCHAAAETGATVLVPGNIYHFGASMPEVLSESAPVNPTTQLGKIRLRMEWTYRAQAERNGFQAFVLRAGDFLDGHPTGGWFDGHIAAEIDRGKVVYPGPLNIAHQWAYLPDFARGLVALAEHAPPYRTFEAIGFPGHILTGEELISLLSELVEQDLTIGKIPWQFLKLVSPFSPDLKGVTQMAYLWSRPHAIDGRQFNTMFPDFQHTPIRSALYEAVTQLLASKTKDPRA